METKINVAEILKNKPQGTKLYDLLYNIDVELDTISTTDTETVVWCTNETDNNTTCHRGYSEFGTVRKCPNGLQILLPSKEMRDWGKFAWKKGDVLVCTDGKAEVIFERFDDDNYTSFVGKHYIESYGKDGDLLDYEQEHLCDTANYTKESDETVQCYINTIEERLGGKLNRGTLEIEKTQPEFKDGDIVCISGMGYLTYGIVKSIDNSSKKLEYYVLNDMSTLKFEDWLSFEDKQIQPITETQQIILFDALAKEGKAWDAKKKMIVDLKPKVELKPFDKVLVRDNDTEPWMPAFFEREYKHKFFLLSGFCFDQCIPYEGNEHLLGTTKDVEG